MYPLLTKSTKISLVAAATASGTTLVSSTGVDMAGWDGVVFVTSIATANAGNFFKALQADASNLSSSADLASSKVTPTTNATVAFIDIFRPSKRYVGVSVTRGSATVVGEIYAIQYRGRSFPVTNDSSTLKGVALTEPSEGTA